MSVQELTQEALKLSEADRESLGYAILGTVGIEAWDDSDLANDILEQRLGEMKKDASKALALEEVFPELRPDIDRK